MKMSRKWKRLWQREEPSFMKTIIKPAAIVAGLSMAVLLSSPVAYALPTDGKVTVGAGAISTSGVNMTVNQQTDKMAVNWQSFNIGNGEKVQFVQPNAQSVVLNRVIGSSSSAIYGQLSANGKVFLVNQNGVHFSPTARVETGALVASALGISDSDFAAGNYRFTKGGASGSVINQGQLTVVQGGYVALLGESAVNEGIIIAAKGTVALGAGEKITLDMTGDGLVNLAVDQGALNAQAANKHLIQADGGLVVMTTRSAGSLIGTVVNNSGVIRANTMSAQNGRIILDAGSGGAVNTGALDSSGLAAGQTGGVVKVLGDSVTLGSGSIINVSGDAGGGTALIGGNYQGKGPEQNATNTIVDANVAIKADAVTTGNGGAVVVWSDGITKFDGTISAKGGSLSGDGGSIETSGKEIKLGDNAKVIATATAGKFGTWLLDPDVIEIISGTSGNVLGLPATGTSQIGATTLSYALSNANVNLQANNWINFKTSFSYTGNRDAALGLYAPTIKLGGNISSTQKKLNLNFGGTYSSKTYAGNLYLYDGDRTITTNGGSITFNGDIGSDKSIYGSPRDLTVNTATGSVAFSGEVKGAFTLSGTTVNKINDLIVQTGPLTLTKNISVAGNMDLVTSRFINNAGSSALSVGLGKYRRIWSTNTDPFNTNTGDDIGGLAYAFKQYNATYGTSTVLGSGNGLLYTYAPTLTVSLTGAVSKTYDGKTSASLTSDNYNVSGEANNDNVTITQTSGQYNDKNAGSGKTVTVTLASDSIAATDSNNKVVYGYKLNKTTFSGNIGTINPKTLTLAPTVQDKVFDGTTQATVTAYCLSGLVGSETVFATSTSATFGDENAANNKTVTISGVKLANGYYGGLASNYTVASSATATADITKRPVYITANAGQSKVYGETDPTEFTYTVGVTKTGEGLVGSDTINSTLSGSLARATGEDAGAYAITKGTLNASSNYSITYKGTNFTINQRGITVVPINTSKIYGSDDPTLEYTLAAGSTLASWDKNGGALGREDGENAGKYDFNTIPLTITNGNKNNKSNYKISIDPNRLNFTINQKEITVIPTYTGKTYGDADPTLSYTLAAGSTLASWDKNGGTLGRASGEDAGDYAFNTNPLTITKKTWYYNYDTKSNYKISIDPSKTNFTINQREITVITTNTSKTYGAADPTLSYTLAPGSTLASWDTSGGTLGRASGEDAGKYDFNTNPLTITKKIRYDDYSCYDDHYYHHDHDDYYYSDSKSNYKITISPSQFTINPAKLTVTADAKSKTYGDADPTLTYTVSGLVKNSKLKIDDTTMDENGKYLVLQGSLTRDAGETVSSGPYAITQGTVNAGNNYTISYTGADLTINPATLTVTADAKSKTYGNADPTLTYQVTGLVKNDKLNIDDTTVDEDGRYVVLKGGLTRVAGETVLGGPYAINQDTVNAGSNYTISYTGANLTITARPITITAYNQSKKQDTIDPTLTYIIGGSGLVNGDTLSGALTRDPGETVGLYPITQGSLAATTNYTVTYVGGTLTITPVVQPPPVQPPAPSGDTVSSYKTENGGISSPITTPTTPPPTTPTGTITVASVGNQSSGFSLSITGQTATITLPNTGTTNNAPVAASGVPVVTVGTQGAVVVDSYNVSSTGNSLSVTSAGPLTNTPATAAMPTETMAGAATGTFTLETGSGTAQFSVVYADGAITIKPLNDAANQVTQDTGTGLKAVAATAMVTAQQNLGAQGAISAVYINNQ